MATALNPSAESEQHFIIKINCTHFCLLEMVFYILQKLVVQIQMPISASFSL